MFRKRMALLLLVSALAALVLCLDGGEGFAESLGGRGGEHEPLPLEVAVALRGHNGRSPVNLSPDGEWVAHTVETDETVPRGTSRAYSATGFPFAEGNSRMEATLSSTGSGETVRLGGPDATSWAGVWSPDGGRVAFYSDEGGEAGLWIWERESGVRRRVDEVVVRPFFGFETVRWAADGRRLLVKSLPEGMTLAEANALLPVPQVEPPAPEVSPGEPSVEVRLSTAARRREGEAGDADGGAPAADVMEPFRRGLVADLAVVDVDAGSVKRIARDEAVRLYAFSPDGRSVAYTVLTGSMPDTQQGLFDLRLHDLAAGSDAVLARGVPLGYGTEWSWSPDGTRLAYTTSGQTGEGRYVVVSVAGGTVRVLENEAPSFAPGEGEVPPIWSADGSVLYGVGDGALWEVDPGSGEAREIARVDGWSFRSLATSWYGSPVAWSPEGGDRLWLFARETEGRRSGIYSVDPATGEARAALQQERPYSHVFSQAASRAGGRIYFVSRDQRQPGEIWSYDVEAGALRQVSRINEDLDGYALGEARLVRWTSDRGEALAGALLLPPDHEPGRRLPLVVWVYGGQMGSRAIDRFGFWGGLPAFNMHVLATRGYAVLAPDAPLRPGHLTDDLVGTVLPGVDAAVEQGYADPERLAIMGQSFGALNTLALLTRTDRFKAAIVTAAVQHPDLFADYLSGRSTGYWEKGQGGMGGTIWEYHDRYLENSPLFDFPDIETPLLIGQGDQDGDLVPVNAIFAALERLGKDVELRIYRGESHVISRKANVLDFWRRRLEFLARHLDLRLEADGGYEVLTPRGSPSASAGPSRPTRRPRRASPRSCPAGERG